MSGANTAKERVALTRASLKRLAERMLAGELTTHLGYAPGEERPKGPANHRNGTAPKTVVTSTGVVPLERPRNRDGSFHTQLGPTRVRRLLQFDAPVLSLCARGASVREI